MRTKKLNIFYYRAMTDKLVSYGWPCSISIKLHAGMQF